MADHKTQESLALNSILVLTMLFCTPVFSAQTPSKQVHPMVRLEDNSDWWSLTKEDESGEVIKFQEREFARSNFQILGIPLSQGLMDRAIGKLGVATTVERGDASTGRLQLCYVSIGEATRTYLIFETGEVNDAFYLFSGSTPWNGSENCFATKVLSRESSTASGLHLGLSPSQVIAILGKPNKLRKGELSYAVHARKKTSPANLKAWRKQHPEMSDKEFMENYQFYDLSVWIVLKFTDSKLSYIAVSKSETY